jgi:hypothetical protein
MTYEEIIDLEAQSNSDSNTSNSIWIWRVFHALSFCIGGISFIIGTALLFPVPTYMLSLSSAVIYTIGSLGFLFVDLQEFFTFTEDTILRFNISLSATGSLAYVIGSIGYIPSLQSISPLLGIWGFIIGSAFIFFSQVWKLYRIGLPINKDALTALLVEGGACIGGLLFLIGSLLVILIPNDANSGFWVLITWLIGSISFSFGGVSLSYRHFILNL